jgi:hypothetical protein
LSLQNQLQSHQKVTVGTQPSFLKKTAPNILEKGHGETLVEQKGSSQVFKGQGPDNDITDVHEEGLSLELKPNLVSSYLAIS